MKGIPLSGKCCRMDVKCITLALLWPVYSMYEHVFVCAYRIKFCTFGVTYDKYMLYQTLSFCFMLTKLKLLAHYRVSSSISDVCAPIFFYHNHLVHLNAVENPGKFHALTK